MERLFCKFDQKAVDEAGTFEGYGSVFDIVDKGDDVVIRGAFEDSLKARNPIMLWSHRQGDPPIGVYNEVREDDVGLYVKGQLALKTARGAEMHELLKLKAINGLSIGYIPRDESYDRATGINTLKKVDLAEVSLVNFPMNTSARVTGVKSISGLAKLSDIEDCLRDAGFSRKEALALIARVKDIHQPKSESSELKEILDALRTAKL